MVQNRRHRNAQILPGVLRTQSPVGGEKPDLFRPRPVGQTQANLLLPDGNHSRIGPFIIMELVRVAATPLSAPSRVPRNSRQLKTNASAKRR
jgi:hypothetical protein